MTYGFGWYKTEERLQMALCLADVKPGDTEGPCIHCTAPFIQGTQASTGSHLLEPFLWRTAPNLGTCSLINAGGWDSLFQKGVYMWGRSSREPFGADKWEVEYQSHDGAEGKWAHSEKDSARGHVASLG